MRCTFPATACFRWSTAKDGAAPPPRLFPIPLAPCSRDPPHWGSLVRPMAAEGAVGSGLPSAPRCPIILLESPHHWIGGPCHYPLEAPARGVRAPCHFPSSDGTPPAGRRSGQEARGPPSPGGAWGALAARAPSGGAFRSPPPPGPVPEACPPVGMVALRAHPEPTPLRSRRSTLTPPNLPSPSCPSCVRDRI